MSRFERLRTDPLFAAWFAQVHPFFWPILWWQLERTVRWMQGRSIANALIRIDWWGGVRIVYLGDKDPDPSAYRPHVPNRPRWDDPVWKSDMPAAVSSETLLVFPILPCESGGFPRSPREGLADSRPNTS